MLVKICTSHPLPVNFNQRSAQTSLVHWCSSLATHACTKKQRRNYLSLILLLHVIVLIWLPVILCVCNSPQSAVSKSMDSLLSVIFMLVPITSLTNKLDLLSEKSLHLANTPLDPYERQREYLQKEYMSIDRPSWPRLVSTIACYWCAGIAFEGGQIDIMVWCGPLRAGLPGLKSDWVTLGQSSHLHQLSLVFVLRPLDWQTCRVLWEGLESLSEPDPLKQGIDPY